MKKEVALFTSVLLLVFFVSLISATTIPIYVRPLLSNGSLAPNTNYIYTLNWTTDSSCSNVIYSNANFSVTTGSDGTAFFNVTIPDNITAIPSYMCEYRDGSLRAVHPLTGQIFDKIYANSINLTDQVYATGNITGSGGFFSSLGSALSRIANLFVMGIDATGNIFTLGNVSGTYILGNGKYLSGIIATASPAGGNTAVQFNDNGATGGNESAFWFNKSSSAVGINGSLVINGVNWSQSKGAIISSGCVASGCYVQYADGTMIEWFNDTNSVTTVSSNGQVFITTINYNFPVSFASVPFVEPFSTDILGVRSGVTWGAKAYNVNINNVTIQIAGSLSTATSNPGYFAIGRWTNLNLGSGSGGGNGIVNTVTNANGTCTQYANGIQECWIYNYSLGSVSITTGASALYRSDAVQNWTFPVPFVNNNVSSQISVNWVGSILSFVGETTGSSVVNSNSQASFMIISPVSGSQQESIDGYAIGRWTNTTNINTPDVSTWGLDQNGNIIQVNSSRNVNITGVLYVNGSYIGSFPSGAIVAFNAPVCPTGWALADGTGGTPDLRGIFLRGSGTNGVLTEANGSTFSAAYGTYHNDSLQGHKHLSSYRIITPDINDGSASGAGPAVWGARTGEIATNPTSDGTDGTPRTGAETRPANYATIYCVKTGSDSGTSTTIWGTVGNTVVMNNQSNNLSLQNTSTAYYSPNASEISVGTLHFINSPNATAPINAQIVAAGPTWYTATFSGIPAGTKAVLISVQNWYTTGTAMYYRPYGSGQGINSARQIVINGANTVNMGGQATVPVDSQGRAEFTATVGSTIYVYNAQGYYI